MVGASSVKCPADAPICVTPNHDEEYGFCTRECQDLFDCQSDDGVTSCSIFVTDIPGIDGGVTACVFHCPDCPTNLECRSGATTCLARQDAGPPEVTVVCEDLLDAGTADASLAAGRTRSSAEPMVVVRGNSGLRP